MANSKEDGNEERKPQKSQRDILQHTEEAALTELERNSVGLSLSAISGGLDIGFSVLMMAVMVTLFQGQLTEPSLHILVSLMYPLGFIFVIMGRSELFTEHTTLAVLPVLQKLAPAKKLFRLWGLVYINNIVGGLVFALILSYLSRSLHYLGTDSLNIIADELFKNGWAANLFGAMLAGWMMGLLAWLVAASRDTISQIFIIIIVTAAIGIAGLPHCIVGNIEAAAGLFNGHVSFNNYIVFLVTATVGNAVGGAFFVALLKYNHTVLSGKEQTVDIENSTSKEGQ
jgi:formate/nitrite transporter FocA (FNT family)